MGSGGPKACKPRKKAVSHQIPSLKITLRPPAASTPTEESTSAGDVTPHSPEADPASHEEWREHEDNQRQDMIDKFWDDHVIDNPELEPGPNMPTSSDKESCTAHGIVPSSGNKRKARADLESDHEDSGHSLDSEGESEVEVLEQPRPKKARKKTYAKQRLKEDDLEERVYMASMSFHP